MTQDDQRLATAAAFDVAAEIIKRPENARLVNDETAHAFVVKKLEEWAVFLRKVR